MKRIPLGLLALALAAIPQAAFSQAAGGGSGPPPYTFSNAQTAIANSFLGVGGVAPTNKFQPLQLDSSGNLQVGGTVNIGTITGPLPAGTAAIGSVIDNLTTVGGATLNLGQTTMANSLPVTLAGNQTTINVQAISPYGVNANQAGTANSFYGAAAYNATNGVNPLLQDASGNLLVNLNTATPAGTNIVGKFGIDQTTLGVTNAVQLLVGSGLMSGVTLPGYSKLSNGVISANIQSPTSDGNTASAGLVTTTQNEVWNQTNWDRLTGGVGAGLPVGVPASGQNSSGAAGPMFCDKTGYVTVTSSSTPSVGLIAQTSGSTHIFVCNYEVTVIGAATPPSWQTGFSTGAVTGASAGAGGSCPATLTQKTAPFVGSTTAGQPTIWERNAPAGSMITQSTALTTGWCLTTTNASSTATVQMNFVYAVY